MLLGPDAGAEPGIVGGVEYPVGAEKIIDHVARKDYLVADRDRDQRHTRERERAWSRSGREISQSLGQPCERQPAPEGNVFPERHEMMLCISGQYFPAAVIGLDRIEIASTRIALHSIGHSRQKQRTFGQRTGDPGMGCRVLVEKTGKGRLRPKQKIDVAGTR